MCSKSQPLANGSHCMEECSNNHKVIERADVLMSILACLDYVGLCTAAMVCKLWREVADTHPVWQAWLDHNNNPTNAAAQPNEAARQSPPADMQPDEAAPLAPDTVANVGPSTAGGAAGAPALSAAKVRFAEVVVQGVQLRRLEPVLGRALHKQEPTQVSRYLEMQCQHGVRYPAAWLRFMAVPHIGELVRGLHPGNDWLETCGAIMLAPPSLAHVGRYMIKILNIHQGYYFWYAVFDEGMLDPPVYASEDDVFWIRPSSSGSRNSGGESAPPDGGHLAERAGMLAEPGASGQDAMEWDGGRSEGGCAQPQTRKEPPPSNDARCSPSSGVAGASEANTQGLQVVPDTFEFEHVADSLTGFWLLYLQSGLAWFREQARPGVAPVRGWSVPFARALVNVHPWFFGLEEGMEFVVDDNGDIYRVRGGSDSDGDSDNDDTWETQTQEQELDRA